MKLTRRSSLWGRRGSFLAFFVKSTPPEVCVCVVICSLSRSCFCRAIGVLGETPSWSILSALSRTYQEGHRARDNGLPTFSSYFLRSLRLILLYNNRSMPADSSALRLSVAGQMWLQFALQASPWFTPTFCPTGIARSHVWDSRCSTSVMRTKLLLANVVNVSGEPITVYGAYVQLGHKISR